MESEKEQAKWLIKCVNDGRMTGGMAAEIEDYCFARRTELEKMTAERDQLRAERDAAIRKCVEIGHKCHVENAEQTHSVEWMLGKLRDKIDDWKDSYRSATARAEAAKKEADRFEGYYQSACRDLSKQVDEIAALEDKLEAAEAHAADLRRALELWKSHVSMPTGPTADYGAILASLAVAKMETDAALARTPAQSLAHLEALVLREAADSVPVGADAHDWFYHLAAKAEADSREEAAHGR